MVFSTTAASLHCIGLIAMDARTGLELQFLLLGDDDQWWRNAFVVANGVFAVRAYTRVAVSRFAYWDDDGLSDATHCVSCTRPLRLYAQIHHESTLFRKRWAPQCTVCEWKTSNPEASLLEAFRLWPPLLESSLWEHVLQFLCLEGGKVTAKTCGTEVLLGSPHLHCLHITAVRRAWHSTLLTGFARADTVLWHSPELMDGIYTSGAHAQAEVERAAWATLSLLCRNPLWLLVASCCPASARNKLPTCGRPMQVLLAFLGGLCCSGDPSWVSLRAGCRARFLTKRGCLHMRRGESDRPAIRGAKCE